MGTYIQYNAFPGIVTRSIGKETWKRLDIDFDQEVVFNGDNQNTVDASDFPEEVIDVFREDGDFKIVESDKRPKAPKQVTGEEYDAAMQRVREYAGLDEDEVGDGAGVATSTASSTARTSASSTAGPSGSGAAKKSTSGKTR